MINITLVIYNVRGGGSVLAALNWANAWAEAGHSVTVIVTHPHVGDGKDFFVHPLVKVVTKDIADRPVKTSFMALKQLLFGLLRLRNAVRASKPDVVISFDGPINVRTLMACAVMQVPIIIFEQVHPAQYSLGEFWGKWRRRLYPQAEVLLNLTQAASDWCGRYNVRNSAVIPNPIVPAAVHARPPLDEGGIVVAAGRLVPQKRFDLLIESFALISDKYPNWNLVINGEGPDRDDLERRLEERGLANRVSLPGWADDMAAEMAKGDFFVLSSEYEGFGNVICEAMAVGLPVVSFDCPSGPGDIVRHEVDGLLVEPLNVEKLAQAMSRMMDDRDLRLRMGERALEVLGRFSLERTLELWDDVFTICRKK